MSFKQTYEQNLNDDMQGNGQPGRAPIEMEDVDLNIKKSASPPPQEEFGDSKEQPPRFSTLYGAAPKATAPRPPPPAPVQQPYDYYREYYGAAPRSRKSGVTIPMPLFIVLAVIFAFESTVLFAYTIIGLYNNAPSRLFPWAGPGTATSICNSSDQQPAINFAPNFVMPQADKALPEAAAVTTTVSATPSTVTVSATPSTTTISATPSTTTISATPSTTTISATPSTTTIAATSLSASSPTSSSTSTSTTANASAAASDLAGLIGALGALSSSTSESIALVTVGPKPSTVTSVKLVTKDPSGNVIPGSMVTLTSVTVIPAASSDGSITSRAEVSAQATARATVISTSATTGWSAVSSVLEDADSSAAATATGS